MVDIGYRQKNQAGLISFCEKVYIQNQDNSADTGAALCVLGYQLLNIRNSAPFEDIERLAQRVSAYVGANPTTPHAVRWVVSLHFIVGKLWLKAGAHDRAKSAFDQCVLIDPIILALYWQIV
ncbi:hypothetical protein GTU79_18335 [Sodalis ligni]|uniref:hypothetical protein n=1 Tax=Sodalis ligni TaxID=2697027 RepID=UPI001BDE8D7B|nr:hypothetical protein [Sodalis ligni]QWA09345.1 hypothetical protein GTU79_18335 [Sodalis ligni]